MDYAQLNKQLEVITNNFNNLSQNITQTGNNITGSVSQLTTEIEISRKNLSETFRVLNEQIGDFTESNNKQAKAMGKMTGWIMFLTFVLVVIGIISVFLLILPLVK